jgi:tRNA(Ile)-lysidine synthase
MSSIKKNQWHHLEHQVLREIQKLEMQACGWSSEKSQNCGILALSGGSDSLALGSILSALKGVLPFEFIVAYVHHGKSKDLNIENFRNNSAQFCQSWALKTGVPFYLLGTHEKTERDELTSEEELRNWRYQQLSLLKLHLEERGKYKNIFYILAQHQNDLLETRLLRLIRGTGLEGLSAMELWKDQKLRPFLGVNKKDILDYAHEKNIQWMEDPTNQINDPFRNWMRNQWLPLLEAKSEGSVKSLARSLELILDQFQESSAEIEELKLDDLQLGIPLLDYLTWSEIKQRRVLAIYMKSLGCLNFTQAHLREIQKQLDKIKVVHTFTVARLRWGINAKRIVAQSLVTHL